nr:DNA polymerase III subunit beta [Liberibacter crescens]
MEFFFHTVKNEEVQKLRAVTTDGHRLAVSGIDAPLEALGMKSIIVPRKAVNELQKILSFFDNMVSVEISDDQIRFTIDSLILKSKLIDATFPDYESVIPVTNNKKMIIDCQNFKKSVDRVSTITFEKSRAIKLALSENKLLLTVENSDIGGAMEDLEVFYDHQSLEISFNSKYLLEIAEKLTSKEVIFLLDQSSSSAIVKNNDNNDVFYVLMPMRV